MAQTGPSGDGRNSSDGIERPTNSEKGLALAGYSYLSNEERTWVFVAYHRFRYRGRALDYEEIYGMATMVMGKEAIPSSTLHFLLTRFDNPQDSLTKEHEEEARKSEQSFLAEVDADFTRYLQNDEEAEDRCRNLEGLTKRLPYRSVCKRFKWGGKRVRRDQLFLCFAVMNFCKDHEGKRHDMDFHKDLLHQKVFHRPLGSSRTSLFDDLENENHRFTKMVAGIIYQDKEILEHFARKAYKKVKEYASEKGFKKPLLNIPSSWPPIKPYAGEWPAMDFNVEEYEDWVSGASLPLWDIDIDDLDDGTGRKKRRRERDSDSDSSESE